MSFRDADAEPTESVALVRVELRRRILLVLDAARAVHPRRDRLDLVAQAHLFGIEEVERTWFGGCLDHSFRELGGSFTPLGEVVARSGSHAELVGDLAHRRVFRGMVARKGVDRDHRGDAMQLDVLDLLAQVGRPRPDVVRTLLEHLRGKRLARDNLEAAGVNLQSADGGDDDRGVRHQPRGAAFDVEEALGAHIGGKPGLGDEEVAAADADQVRDHRRVAGRDVAERTGVDEDGRVLERLEQVRLDRVAQDDCHRSRGVELLCRDRFAIGRVADHDPSQPPAHVLQRCGQRQDRHDLRGGRDVKARLPDDAVFVRTEADDDVAKHPVADVDHAPPRHAVAVDQRLVVVDVVVDHRREQVVRSSDGVHVTGQVQVQSFHRDDLAVAAAGGSALDAERRAHRGLANRNGRALADMRQSLPQADGRGCLALSQRRRGDRGDDNVFGLGPVLELVDRVELDLRHVMAVRLEQVRPDPHPGRDLGHRQQSRLARDLEISRKLNLHHTTSCA